MTFPPSNDAPALHGLKRTASPRPSAQLLSALEDMRPVRTRVPARTLVLVAAAALIYPVYAFAMFPLRRDLGALPAAWVATMAVVWACGFALPLLLALLPRRGQVLPDSARAGAAAALAAATLILVGLLFTIDAPGRTVVPQGRWAGFPGLWWHCVSFGLKVTVPTIFVAALALRRLGVVSLARLGAAIGASAGALAGLTLHGLCPYGGGVHVGLAHGGGVLVGALLGALWLPLIAGTKRA